MNFLSVVIALGIIQFWGSGGILHRDAWFSWWSAKVGAWVPEGSEYRKIAVVLVVPITILGLLQWNLQGVWGGSLLLLLNIFALLYSFGRGQFSLELQQYLRHWRSGDLQSAYRHSGYFRGSGEPPEVEDACSLHGQMLKGVAYRGFERYFAVIFWFLILGACGAVLYRMAVLCSERRCQLSGVDPDQLSRPVWWLEWLPVRLLGLTMALAGDFGACFQAWKGTLKGEMQGSAETLWKCGQRALGIEQCAVPDSTAAPRQITEAAMELEAVVDLQKRSLILWITILAVVTIVG